MKHFPVLSLVFLAASLSANPIGWRNDGTGLYPKAISPGHWSPTEKVVWAVALPEWGNSCPVVLPDRIFLCAEPNLLLCLDKQGKILWQKANPVEDTLSESDRQKLPGEEAALKEAEKSLAPLRAEFDSARAVLREAEKEAKQNPQDGSLKKAVGEGRRKVGEVERRFNEGLARIESGFPLAGRMRPAKTHAVNGFSSDTPLYDGNRVFVSYGNGVVAAYSPEGKRLWIRFVEKPVHVWGKCASPRLSGGLLIIQYVKAWGLDPITGEVKWSVACPKAWGTPEPIAIGQTTAFVTDQGEIRSSVDGRLLAETAQKLEHGCPLVIGDSIFAASTGSAWCYRVYEKDGKIQASQVWQTDMGDKKDRFYASPLLWQGIVYFMNHKSVLTAVEADTGKKLYEKSLGLGGTAYPSPILCGDQVIVSADTGKSVVFKAGREFQELARPVFEPFRATPVCEGKRMYVRTSAKGPEKPGLYCLGE